jgi:hypothetical protein
MTPEEESLVSRLAEEYKILQDKIDKIGAFRFTIKGWSITAVIGALFAGSATSSLSPYVWLVSLTLLIVGFCYFEMQQVNLSRHFGRRAITIENVISRILRTDARKSGSKDFIALRFVPGIAHHLGQQHPRPARRRSFWDTLREAHVEFYFAQAILVLVVVFSHKPLSKDVVIKGAQITVVPTADPRNPTASNPDNKPDISAPQEGRATATKPEPTPKKK